jgi:drug/metabolite transporter (DMT)-like permease
MSPRVLLLTALALICFAGNSLLCRLALAAHRIDAASFTAVRLVSGALVLLVLSRGRVTKGTTAASFISAAALFAYAAPFSFAYLRLGAGMGALILFGCVQATMLGWGLVRGERPGARTWLGIAIAVSGLVGLTLRGKSAPDPLGAALMSLAGVAWGVYTLRGRGSSQDPLLATASSFVRSVPFALLLLVAIIPIQGVHVTTRGIVLAVASGAVASGLGYSIWYAALRHLSATHAAVLQLLVPVLAAAGAVAWLDEKVTLRFGLASAAILGGVALTIRGRIPSRR